MSPDERDQWRLGRVEEHVDKLDERLQGLGVEVAVHGRALEEHAEEIRDGRADARAAEDALWREVGGLRRLFIGVLVTIATSAVGVAIAVALGAIGGR